ncbi:MAG: exosortase system-associated protein, TIGR04073 family [Verrucomicrobia bacterium]|nr:exosortase system-associated protein, TIGR04073 family [Verrucomicrobiota bacterium]
MRLSFSLLAMAGAAALLGAGCAGPERKLGRGIVNLTEFTRAGEWRRSVEQTALYEGPEAGYTTGFIRGANRTFARTMLGVAEVATFPFPTPTYDPIELPYTWFWDSTTRVKAEPFSAKPPYPDSYRPKLIADQIFATDTAIGFAGGDVAPILPGSRFKIFDH